jgi:Universal stress protein family
MGTSVENGWRESSRTLRRAPAQRRTSTRYSMTWSARPCTDGGIVKPSALAVLRLMTRLQRSFCRTGRSPGFAPLKIWSTCLGARRAGRFPTLHSRWKGSEADLIAMTTHGRSALGRLLFGSVAETVMRRANIPVFIVRAAEDAQRRAAASADAEAE